MVCRTQQAGVPAQMEAGQRNGSGHELTRPGGWSGAGCCLRPQQHGRAPHSACSSPRQHTVSACSGSKQRHAAHQGSCSSLGPRYAAPAEGSSPAELTAVHKAGPRPGRHQQKPQQPGASSASGAPYLPSSGVQQLRSMHEATPWLSRHQHSYAALWIQARDTPPLL